MALGVDTADAARRTGVAADTRVTVLPEEVATEADTVEVVEGPRTVPTRFRYQQTSVCYLDFQLLC